MDSRKGYRFFACDCGQQWAETSRDRFSPSGEACECCGDWVHPHDRATCEEIGEDIPVDDMGNLREYKTILLATGTPPLD